MPIRLRLSVLTLFAVFLADPSASHAFVQSGSTTADLRGIVRDASQGVIQHAGVTVTHIDTNVTRTTTSGLDGRFIVPALPPGAYRLRVEAPGFSAHVVERLELSLGSSVEAEIVLLVANLVEVVTVAGTSSVVNRQGTAVGNVVSRRQIEQLPTNGRNFISFTLITPGVASDRMPLQGAAATSGLSFSGQRARSNNITVDGLDNNDATIGSVRATFSQEAVREFQVLTQSYSAEFGGASGGVVNIVTRSGSNTPSGSAFAYVRDDILNAKEHFEKFDPAGREIVRSKAPYSQKQFGGVFGGPIRRDKTFFFGAFERLGVTANNLVNIDTLAAAALDRAGFPTETGHVAYGISSNQAIGKVDHSFRSTDTLTFRYNYADGYNENLEAWGGLVARSRGAALDNRDQMFAASYTAVLSSLIVNELRFQVASRSQAILPLDPTCSGPCDRADEGGPTIEVAGVANVGRYRAGPQLRDNVRYQILDTVSYQAGNHLWKAGVDFNVVDHPTSSLPLHMGGRYIFTSLPAIPGLLPAPVSAIEALALGLPAGYVQGYGNPDTAYVTSNIAAFVQDQWRVSDRLTVQAGVRYQTQFWPARAYSVPGYEGTYGIRSDRNDVAPRLGVTWKPARSGSLSVHSAYGLYFDNVMSGLVAINDVINGAPTGLRTLVRRFPQSLAAWNAPGRRLPESAVGSYPSLIISMDPNLRTSYSRQFSAGVSYELGPQLIASADFVTVRGLHQIGTIDYNPVVPSLGAARRPEDVGGVAGTSASILQYTPYGDTWYRGLTLSVRKRLTNRAQFLASYVLSKAEDNSSDFQSAFIPQNNGRGRDPNNTNGLPVGFDPAAERGPSQQDQRHRFVFSGLYSAPAGIQVAGIVTVGSGAPFNILAGTDLNGDGDGGTFPSDRARRDPADPASAVSRNAGRLRGEATVDVRVSRRFRLAGVSAIEPMLEVFNLFNRVNYTDINNVFGVGAYPSAPLLTYGQFLRAAPPRQAQLAVRILF